MSEDRTSVVCVICARDEEETITDVVAAVTPFADRVLVVDGHSRDSTRRLAVEAGALVISDSGRGKGEAIRTAIHGADGDILVFIDADGSHDPADICRLTAPIIAGQADLVIGSRIRGGSDESCISADTFVRMTGGALVALIIRWRWGVDITDSQNGFRAIRRSVFSRLDLRSDGFEIEQEMVIKAARAGLRVIEVASHEYARAGGRSKNPLSRGWKHIFQLMRELPKRGH